jgi:hypothetical protein
VSASRNEIGFIEIFLIDEQCHKLSARDVAFTEKNLAPGILPEQRTEGTAEEPA